MKRNFSKRLVAAVLCMVMLCSICLTGCGGSKSGTLEFWVYGNENEVATYTKMVNEFNATYGAEHGITVNISRKAPGTGDYHNIISNYASTNAGPDVFLQNEDNFKGDTMNGLNCDITAELEAVTDIDMGDIQPSIINRLRFNTETNTSNENDPIYGLPLNTNPTALFYNETLFEKAGITVISVDEEDLEAWNNDQIPDNRGKTKSDYGITIDVPAKGYFRENPYYGAGSWTKPEGEVQIFNNRIACNWDEIEDLARLFTPAYNPQATEWGCDYGYFTEWWFNYGWSVGGDCLSDLTGNGDWNFSLLDSTPNYIVNDGCTYTGVYTDTVYQAGQTLVLSDKLDVPKGELAVADSEGNYTYGGEEIGIRSDIEALVDEGVLSELPSTAEAFKRYLKLGAASDANIDGESGIYVSPNPEIFNNRTSVNYFFSGNIAMLVTYSIYVADINEYMNENGNEYDVAPLAIYKEYENPDDCYDDTVLVEGKAAGHNNCTAMVVRTMSQKKDKAAAFIKWMAGVPGQSLRVEDGWLPNQASLIDQVNMENAPANAQLFSEVLSYQTPGDWWYMPDYKWIDEWAKPLNTDVRNGKMSYYDWKNAEISETNAILLNYKKYSK